MGKQLKPKKTSLKKTGSFTKIFSERNVTDINLHEYLNIYGISKLFVNQTKLMEGKISKEEATLALSNMKNSKSPGSDGFTAEFYKFFWKDIGYF
jgi:hypothetical protein